MNSHEFVLVERLSEEQKASLSTYKQKIQSFIQNHKDKGIIMITSGGTSVPLQKRAVRFIQNFSTGLRGSLLAQQVLQHDQPLIYFYRQNSHLPFSKANTYNNLLLAENQDQIQKVKAIRKNLKKYKNNLLLLPFKTIYLYLNGLLLLKQILPPTSTIVLCAAVSDFIPKEVAAHKIHTCQQLSLELISSPKLLGKVAEGEKHLCVSFKLQTDPDKLKQRVDFALQKYGVDLVIGNVLGDKSWVNVTYNTTRFPEQFKNGKLFKGTKEGEPQAFIVQKMRQAQKHKFST